MSFFSQNIEDASDKKRGQSLFYHFLSTVFDVQSLQLVSVTPDSTPDDSGSGSGSGSGKASPDFDKRCQVLTLRLESILSRFVSDYRGIFAIELECAAANK